MSVVLVDDDDDLRETLALALELDGCLVVTFTNGQTALDYLSTCSRARLPELVITDLAMPGYSGLRLLDEIKTLCVDNPGTKVVAMTGFGDSETHDVVRRLGATASLDKPVDLAAFRVLVQTIAAQG